MMKYTAIKRGRYPRLPYYERTNGKHRDLRGAEIRFHHPNKPYKYRWARISINGQYQGTKQYYEKTRYANPGWSFGTQHYLVNWTHFRNHCWHLSFNWRSLKGMRGVTFSYGKSL